MTLFDYYVFADVLTLLFYSTRDFFCTRDLSDMTLDLITIFLLYFFTERIG